ncbi:unnamed protein product [Chrysoparadoxa australica]
MSWVIDSDEDEYEYEEDYDEDEETGPDLIRHDSLALGEETTNLRRSSATYLRKMTQPDLNLSEVEVERYSSAQQREAANMLGNGMGAATINRLLETCGWSLDVLVSRWFNEEASVRKELLDEVGAGGEDSDDSSQVCAVCLDKLPETGDQPSFSCGHALHSECFTQMVIHRIRSLELPPFQCLYRQRPGSTKNTKNGVAASSEGNGIRGSESSGPVKVAPAADTRCKGLLEIETVELHALEAFDHDLLETWKQLSNKQVESIRKGPFTKCPSCPCRVRRADFNPSVMSVLCRCGTRFCVCCRNEPHEPVPCIEAEQWNRCHAVLTELLTSGDEVNVDAVARGLFEEASGGAAEGEEGSGEEIEDSAGGDLAINMSASEALAATTKVMLETTKPCPKCFSPSIRLEGCNTMRCSQCQMQYCWNCLREAHTHGVCEQSVDLAELKIHAKSLSKSQRGEAMRLLEGLVLYRIDLEREEDYSIGHDVLDTEEAIAEKANQLVRQEISTRRVVFMREWLQRMTGAKDDELENSFLLEGLATFDKFTALEEEAQHTVKIMEDETDALRLAALEAISKGISVLKCLVVNGLFVSIGRLLPFQGPEERLLPQWQQDIGEEIAGLKKLLFTEGEDCEMELRNEIEKLNQLRHTLSRALSTATKRMKGTEARRR